MFLSTLNKTILPKVDGYEVNKTESDRNLISKVLDSEFSQTNRNWQQTVTFSRD